MQIRPEDHRTGVYGRAFRADAVLHGKRYFPIFRYLCKIRAEFGSYLCIPGRVKRRLSNRRHHCQRPRPFPGYGENASADPGKRVQPHLCAHCRIPQRHVQPGLYWRNPGFLWSCHEFCAENKICFWNLCDLSEWGKQDRRIQSYRKRIWQKQNHFRHVRWTGRDHSGPHSSGI